MFSFMNWELNKIHIQNGSESNQLYQDLAGSIINSKKNQHATDVIYINSLSASLLLNIFLSFEVGIAHAIANFKWKENTSSLKN